MKHILQMSGNFAGIQYAGLPGISSSCQHAVMRLVQYGDRIKTALILSCDGHHGLLLTVEPEELVAVKSGFSSGYAGEGPRTFAEVLRLLREVDAEIDECEVSAGLLERLDVSALTVRDMTAIESAPRIRPIRWHNYVHDGPSSGMRTRSALGGFRAVMPWAVIDDRIADLARKFFESPDDSILTGFRRLEDSVRERTGIHEHGAKLFSLAFAIDDSKLVWNVKDPSEQKGRAQLFTAAFMAYRNPRAHRELGLDEVGMLAEFLILNQLFLLERQSAPRVSSNPSAPSAA